eukprot:3094410-Prymnesium_polylepis.2
MVLAPASPMASPHSSSPAPPAVAAGARAGSVRRPPSPMGPTQREGVLNLLQIQYKPVLQPQRDTHSHVLARN